MKMKPAPGPWLYDDVTGFVRESTEPRRDVCDFRTSSFCLDDDKWHGFLIAEAGTVHHETGLSPRELLEQRDGLLRALENARQIIASLVADESCDHAAWICFSAAIAATKPEAVKGGEG